VDTQQDQPSERATDIYQSLLIAHQIGLLKLGSGLAKKAITQFNVSEEALVAQLLKDLADLELVTPSDYARKKKEIDALIQRLAVVRQESWDAVYVVTVQSLKELASWELAFNQQAIEKAVGVGAFATNTPSVKQLEDYASRLPFQGKPLREWFEALSASDRARLSDAVTQGLSEGASIEQIVARVRGTAKDKFEAGVTQTARRQLEGVVRTVVNHVSNGAREEFWKANRNLFAGVKWVSTLDGRTSMICRALDGAVAALPGQKDLFPPEMPRIIPPHKRPPAHFSCRSLVVSVLNPFGIAQNIGVRPFVRSVKGRKQREEAFSDQARERAGSDWSRWNSKEKRRATNAVRQEWAERNIGTVPKETTFAEWLRAQSAEFQSQVLGPTRYKLFSQGGLKLDRFVESHSGREWTLDELRSRESEAFQKAGI
jgi:hypothetical protein